MDGWMDQDCLLMKRQKLTIIHQDSPCTFVVVVVVDDVVVLFLLFLLLLLLLLLLLYQVASL